MPTSAYARKLAHPDSAACFDAPSYYELTVQGKKLIGSAQVRKHGYLLQHGSLLLEARPEEIVEVLQAPPQAREGLRQLLQGHALNLHEALGRPVSPQEALAALVQGFASALQIQLEPQELTPAEILEAQNLAAQVYSQEAWTKRR